ncbi:FAD-dependent oxidoreductase [Paraconexibacter antarcticus]|uniref:Pyridine nucleotide-disulfide oxidoreductase domain-containing protein 2 n=1 Tax=Paraconexibacter antarcticus TaxID=2949664 RepID=A0ABY5DXW5_9ACTN|nr:FAD-dependent oxidoreductase [Paraconexibacter antarcticus]UTI65647.1 FAD-dependent oxidoreductase [Paraconexibacter antarcticus]
MSTEAAAPLPDRAGIVIAGGGHNGLVAAAYLARAGRDVLLLEASGALGGAAVSSSPWPGVDVRLSRYSYLVSLFPRWIAADLGVELELVRRRVPAYTPVGDGGVFGVPGSPFADAVARLAPAVFASLTEPLRSEADLRALAGDDATWDALVRRPLGATLRAAHAGDDVGLGIVATDALIGTFTSIDDPARLANRCFLYHVIGGGTGDWDVPVGGMGAVTGALAGAARAAGARLVTGARVTAVASDADGVAVTVTDPATGAARSVAADRLLANLAPHVLDRLRGRPAAAPAPEGAQLKVNLLLARLPRLRDPAVDPADAFAGTFHVNESASQLDAAYAQAAAGRIPDVVPCEIYCHSLSDPTILGPDLRAAGAHTLTCFALHLPARLFTADPEGAREATLAATLASLDSVLAEPITDCVLRGPDGAPCVEARSPVDLERDLGLPGGHIFHRDLQWPFAETEAEVGTWGVETDDPRILLCGAGARRGGGVSGIPGHNAAMAVLGRTG